MSPRTPEQFEAIREEKRSRILDAALHLFGTQGYNNTSISQIAKKADISKGLIYNYFESKEAVVQEILNSGIDQMLNILDVNRDGYLEPAELESFIHEMFGQLEKNPEFWRLYFSILMQPDIYSMVREKVDELARPLMKMAIDYLSRAGFENPQGETMVFSALIDGIGLHYVMEPAEYPVEMVKNVLLKRYVEPFKDS